jgi:nitrogen fixation NifU-like protein
MMDLRELYQDIILDHGRKPRNFRKLDQPSHSAQGHNPLCGDRVTVYLAVEGDRIADVAFEGRGCAISTASSSLMTEVLKGKTLGEAEQLFQAFHATVTGADAPETPLAQALEDELDRLAPLSGVRAYPARVKCATLPWHAVEAALRTGGTLSEPVKTE